MPSTGNVMLAVYQKRTEKIDIKTPIAQYVVHTYGQQMANSAIDDLQEINDLRNEVHVQTGTVTQQREYLCKYFRALKAIETRFPISRDKDAIKVYFAWYDSFQTKKRTQQTNIHFEKAAVLFNVGAVLSQHGLNMDRSTSDGLRDACDSFQRAAGAFEYLRNVVGLKVEHPRPVDVGTECCGMLEKLFLAQAQECVYEKACQDKKSAAITARLAKQAAIMYAETARSYADPTLVQHFEKSWAAHSRMKSIIYEAEALMQMAVEASKTDDIAPQIARLRAAADMLNTNARDAKLSSPEMQRQYFALKDKVDVMLAKAEKDNNSIYLVRVPNNVDLPAINPALLVKSIRPEALNVAPEKENWFSELIPDSSAKSLSKYTDMVDGVVRAAMDTLAAATDEARLRLKEWELPDLLNALDPTRAAVALPDALRAQLETIQNYGGVQHLRELSTEIANLRREADAALSGCETQLNEEAREDDELRRRYEGDWRRAASNVLSSHLREKINGYRSNLNDAGQSDERVLRRMAEQEPSFGCLTIDHAASTMPSLQVPLMTTSDMDPAAAVANLRAGLDRLNALASERAALEDQLKQTKEKDNILPKLMGGAGSPDELFVEELKKYESLKAAAATNASQQTELLQTIAMWNQQFRRAYNVDDWRNSCGNAATGVKKAIETYNELMSNLGEGLRFYTSLAEVIRVLQQHIGDFVTSRRIERDDLVQDIQAQRSERLASEAKAKELQDQEAARQRMSSMSIQPQQPPAPSQSYPPPPSSGYAQQQPSSASSYGYPGQQPAAHANYSQPSSGYQPSAYPPAAHQSQPPPAAQYPPYQPQQYQAATPYGAPQYYPPPNQQPPAMPPAAYGNFYAPPHQQPPAPGQQPPQYPNMPYHHHQ